MNASSEGVIKGVQLTAIIIFKTRTERVCEEQKKRTVN